MSEKAGFAVLLLFFLVLANMQFMWSAKASRTWTVDNNGSADFHTIQDAVNAASDGDTVLVHGGTYYEHVSVNKTILLIGESPYDTILDANFSSPTAILIHADNVTIRNLMVQNSYYSRWHWDSTGGIYLAESNGCTVESCIVTGNQNGINLQGSDGNKIANNLVTGNGVGIKVGQSSDNNQIEGNWMLNVSYYGDSMVIDMNSNNNTIVGNCFYNGFVSLIIYSPAAGVVYYNDFMNPSPVVLDAGLPGFDFAFSKDGEGNFWVDYAGVDKDGDGLGDTPYVIQYSTTGGNATDTHPLIKPINWLQGDVNYDTVVNIVDISIIAKAFGSRLGDANWNLRCDLNNDKTINILDLSMAASSFAKRMTWSPS
jgi:nitrous oxidase accessory protein